MIKILIGRSVECQICYEGVAPISSKHAELIIGDDGRMMFTDYSTNGTMVNGQMINHKTIPVSYGEEIIFPGNVALDWNLVAAVFNRMRETPSAGAAQQPSQSAPAAQPQQSYYQSTPVSPNMGSGETLSFSTTLSDGFAMGARNSLSYLAAMVLYILTIWIPYINIGTTIAIMTLPLLYAKGEKSFNPFVIFDSSYRRKMGDFLLLSVFVSFVTISSMLFMFIPSVVLMLTYSLSLLFLMDREQDPIAAMQSSQKATYGSKWIMFGVNFVFALCYGLISGLFIFLTGLSASAGVALAVIVGLLSFAVLIIMMSVAVGIQASVWKQLNTKIE